MQDRHPLVEVHQYGPCVNEFEGTGREVVRAKIVSKDGEVRRRQGGQEICLQVGGCDVTGRSDMVAEPTSDRAAAPSDFEAAGTRFESKALDTPHGERVESLLEQLQSPGFVDGNCGNA